ncbi:hypothetical protein Taro_039150, partial [Colocasia esculenta]|nr:hypothetical protein [Colocasia esculenta]
MFSTFFTGRSFDDALINGPSHINVDQWQQMCEIWNQEEYQQKTHGREATRPDIFQMSQTRLQPDGSVFWTNEQCKEKM